MKQQEFFTTSEFKKNFVKNPKGKKRKKEEKIQMLVCKHLREKYPDVIFACDLSSGMKLPIHIAAKNKAMRSSKGQPDLMIAHRGRFGSHIWSGLFIELKSEDAAATTLKDGSISKSKHVQSQHQVHEALRAQGYKVCFVHGFEQAKKVIDEYLG